jgi:hypothetical protein
VKLFKLAAQGAFVAGNYDLAVRIICDQMGARHPEAAPMFFITYEAPRMLKIVLGKERRTYCFEARSLVLEWWEWDGTIHSFDRILIE